MSDPGMESIRALAAWMREVGARRVKWGNIELELAPPADPYEPEPVAPPPDLKPQPEAKCRCGHSLDLHGPAGCLADGCTLEMCLEPDEHAAPEDATNV